MNTFLVRHTKPAVPEGLCYGRTEVPLADTFHAEAVAVRAALPSGPWRLVSSPAERCRRLAAFLGAPVTCDDRVRELHFGEWENRLWGDLPRAATEHWLADFVHRQPPGGESFGDLAARASAAVAELNQEADGRPLVIVTHAGVIRAMLAAQRKIPLSEVINIPVAFGSVHALTESERTIPSKPNFVAPS